MDMDLAYANSAFIPGSERLLPMLEAKAAAFRAMLGPRALPGRAYGDGAAERFDLFLPEGAPRGVMVFVHGGYWIEGDRSLWSHLAAGAIGRGWACAMPGYPLAPDARVGAIVRRIAQAVPAISAQVPGPLVVTGHSAGGHLAARMGCADMAVRGVVRVVPIAPLADLEPLSRTSMQGRLRLDEAEIAAESPARRTLGTGVSAHVWVGGQERPAFLWHARLLSEAWACPWTVDPGRHHFDVVDGLENPRSALMDVALGGL